MFHTVPNACRKRTHKDVKVKEEGHPGGGLMLGHGGDDWNMDFGVPCVPQRIETTTPGVDNSCNENNRNQVDFLLKHIKSV